MARVDYHDPFVPVIPRTREHSDLAGMKSVPLADAAKYDAVLIVTDHSCIDWQQLVDAAAIVIDTRNATAPIKRRDKKVFPA